MVTRCYDTLCLLLTILVAATLAGCAGSDGRLLNSASVLEGAVRGDEVAASQITRNSEASHVSEETVSGLTFPSTTPSAEPLPTVGETQNASGSADGTSAPPDDEQRHFHPRRDLREY